ncbi:acyl-CoA dehydrogenase family protein [Candidatus Kaiserbacteria bacterium]|nr:acyl-CoA dehydrogenase family protein [Candidatus Kaiserbacteria bacterium]
MRWTEPHDDSLRAILDTVRKFGEEELLPAYTTHEEEGKFPAEPVKKAGSLGLFGLTIPEQYGGMGMNTVAASYVAREVAYYWPSFHLIWTANSSLAAFPIMYAGSEEQKKRILPKLASGEILGCYALTEPNAGSDARSMKIHAHLQKDGWVVNGTKTFITNALHASVAVMFARTGFRDISAFVLESAPGLKHPGVNVRYLPKRVLKSSDFCEISFADAVLPEDTLLQGDGWDIAMKTLDGGRINIAAQAIGMAMWIFDTALEWTKTRRQFDRAVWDNQKVRLDFAQAHARLEAAWTLVLAASEMRDRGEYCTKIASEAKENATEIAWQYGGKLATYFGGMAVTQEMPWLPRLMDIFPTLIYEGANNIQLEVIAKNLDK